MKIYEVVSKSNNPIKLLADHMIKTCSAAIKNWRGKVFANSDCKTGLTFDIAAITCLKFESGKFTELALSLENNPRVGLSLHDLQLCQFRYQ